MQSASVALASSFPSAADVAVRKPPATAISFPGVKPASALEVRPAPEMVSFGIGSLDQLTGGIPRGALTEMIGPTSSGRTSVMMSLMAEVTRRQEVCAVIDATDSFDPVSAKAAGVDLKRVLWVRCGKNSSQQPAASSQFPHAKQLPGFRLGARAGSNAQRVRQAITSGCFEAARGRREPSATMNNVAPPAKNISWSIHENYDARLRHAMVHGGETRESWSAKHNRDWWNENRSSSAMRPNVSRTQLRNFAEIRKAKWNCLDQVLKATDLLIQSGGFGLIVIDLGDVSPEQARRIPLTSWFRFRRAVENTPAILLLVARVSCAKTCASLVMDFSAAPVKSGPFTGKKEPGAGRQESEKLHSSKAALQRSLSHVYLLDGLSVHVQLLHTRLERKPRHSVAANLETRTVWKKSG